MILALITEIFNWTQICRARGSRLLFYFIYIQVLGKLNTMKAFVVQLVLLKIILIQQ
jgi:hypothetical protein